MKVAFISYLDQRSIKNFCFEYFKSYIVYILQKIIQQILHLNLIQFDRL